jgi:hypothetical protein
MLITAIPITAIPITAIPITAIPIRRSRYLSKIDLYLYQI